MRQLRVLVVDDHGLIVAAVRLALEQEQDIEVVGDVRAGLDVLPAVAGTQPDVVLLDIRMPDCDGLEVLDQLRAHYPQVKVVMLSAIDDPEVAQDAIERGAVAYLDKGTDPVSLAATLRTAISGNDPVKVVSPRTASSTAGPPLTEREREILIRVACGRTNPTIARDLFLSEQTVKYHLTHVYRKLGVKGRAEAVRFVFEHGLFDAAEGSSESMRQSGGSATVPPSTGASMSAGRQS